MNFKVIHILCIVALSYCASISACQFKMGWENWPPYMYLDESGKPVGIDIETISLATQMMDCKLELLEIPWRRVLKEAKSGDLHLVYGAAKSPDREVWGNYSIAYRSEVMHLYVLKGQSQLYQFKTVADLQRSHFQVAILRGTYYGKAFSSIAKNQQYQPLIAQVLNAEQMIKMLTAGRVQGFIGDAIFISKELKRLGVNDQIEIHPLVIARTDLHVIFSKKSTSVEQLERFNQALKTIQSNGTWQKIVAKYQ